MKKFVVIESRLNKYRENGRRIINCTVQEMRVVAESDNYEELQKEYWSKKHEDEHHIYNYSIEKRAAAKKNLAFFESNRAHTRELENRFYRPCVWDLSVL